MSHLRDRSERTIGGPPSGLTLAPKSRPARQQLAVAAGASNRRQPSLEYAGIYAEKYARNTQNLREKYAGFAWVRGGGATPPPTAVTDAPIDQPDAETSAPLPPNRLIRL